MLLFLHILVLTVIERPCHACADNAYQGDTGGTCASRLTLKVMPAILAHSSKTTLLTTASIASFTQVRVRAGSPAPPEPHQGQDLQMSPQSPCRYLTHNQPPLPPDSKAGCRAQRRRNGPRGGA